MPYQTVTLDNLTDQLQERWEGGPFWTAEEARTAFNEGLRVWNMLTGAFKRTIPITTTANQPWISLPDTLVDNVHVNFASYPMDITSIFDLDNGRVNWQGETTTTGGGVPTRPTLWAPAGELLMAIWPADAEGGNHLVVDGVRDTPSLVLTTDFVDLGEAEHHAIIGYALHYCTFKEGGQRFAASMKLYREFLSAAADQNARLRASGFFIRAMSDDAQWGQLPMRHVRPREMNRVRTQ